MGKVVGLIRSAMTVRSGTSSLFSNLVIILGGRGHVRLIQFYTKVAAANSCLEENRSSVSGDCLTRPVAPLANCRT